MPGGLPSSDDPSRRAGHRAAPAIRPATPADASAISRVIVETVRVSNAQDYPPAVIDRIAGSFNPAAVLAMMAGRQTFVAVVDGAVVGTGALDGATIRSLFVQPAAQRHGIGGALMAEILRLAAAEGVADVVLRSSLTALDFYKHLGFETVREDVFGEERTFVMHRAPGAPLRPGGGM